MKTKLIFVRNLEDLYYYLMILFYTMSVLFFLDDCIQFRFHRPGAVILCFSILFLSLLIKDNKQEAIMYYLVSGLIVFILIVLKVTRVSFIGLFAGMQGYLSAYSLREKNMDSFYAMIFAGIMEIGILIVVSLTIRYRIWKWTITVIMAVSVIILALTGKQFQISTIAGILFLVEMCVIEVISKSWGKYFLLPFCLLAVVIPSLLPVSKEPVNWSVILNAADFTKDKIESTYHNLMLLFGKEKLSFSIGEIGYSENGIIGGILNSTQDKTQLSIESDRGPNSYLIGSVYQNYTGVGWSVIPDAINPETEDYRFDCLELLYALAESGFTEEQINSFVRETKWSIEFKDIDTGTLFYPLKTYLIDEAMGKEYTMTGSNLYFKKVYGKGKQYDIAYLDIDYDNEAIEQMISRNLMQNPNDKEQFYRGMQGVLEDEMKDHTKLGILYQQLGLSDQLDEKMQARGERIQELYTELPASVPDRLFELSNQICQTADNDYEKCKRIEKYLRSLKYTYRVETVTSGQDVVDYFLFDSKEGYCTYFASAMTVLCREQNIPARYVEGFICESNLQEAHTLDVKGTNAHAWCEVYFPGTGWIPFESTPIGYVALYNDQQEIQYSFGTQMNRPTQTTDLEAPEEQTKEQMEEEYQERIYLFQSTGIIFGSLLLIIVLIGIIYYKIQKNIRKKIYQGMSVEQKILAEVNQIVRIMKRKGIFFEKNLTSKEMIFQICSYCDKKYEFMQLYYVFCRARYSGAEMNDGEENFKEIRIYMEQEYLSKKRIISRIKYHLFDAIE